MIISLPVPPVMMSLPTPPVIVSTVFPPVIVSAPLPLVIVLVKFPAVIVKASVWPVRSTLVPLPEVLNVIFSMFTSLFSEVRV